jgi:hypothetical protein
MTAGERLILTSGWNGLVVFVGLLVLDAGLMKTVVITLFVLVSCLLDFGRRWLMRGGVVIALITIAVTLGFPPPAQWLDLAKITPGVLISNARTSLCSEAPATPK